MSANVSALTSPILSPTLSTAPIQASSLPSTPTVERRDAFVTRQAPLNPLRLSNMLSEPTYRRAGVMVLSAVLESGAMLAVHAGLMACPAGWAYYAGAMASAIIAASCAHGLLAPLLGDQVASCVTKGTVLAVLFALPLPGRIQALGFSASLNAKDAATLCVASAAIAAGAAAALSHVSSRYTQPLFAAVSNGSAAAGNIALVLLAVRVMGLPVATSISKAQWWHAFGVANYTNFFADTVSGLMSPSAGPEAGDNELERSGQGAHNTGMLSMAMIYRRIFCMS